MCGRTCLTLDPEQVLCACKYKPKTDKLKSGKNTATAECKTEDIKEVENQKCASDDSYIMPEWRAEYNCGRIYKPSYNIAPTDITPVLISAEHFRDGSDSAGETRIVVPMMWGMIPFWHKGDYRRHGLTTNNCRLEHLLESKLYRGPFRRGQRCVVLCEGFYEWQTTKSAKPSERAAYLVYMKQENDVKIYDKSTWAADNIKLLKMAGLFDVWEDENGDKMYSYSVITFESSKIMSWMHHRMPAILETEQQVDDWLDFKRVSDEVALAALRPATDLIWHQVTNLVNNSRNKSDQCNKPMELAQKPAKPAMNKTMLAWLNVRQKREEEMAANKSDDEDDSCPGTCGAEKRYKSDSSTTDLEDGGGGTDSECKPVKRPRFSDFKKSRSSGTNTSASDANSAAESSNEKTTTSVDTPTKK